MCSTTLPEPLVNRDPGDETHDLDMPRDEKVFAALERPSTAPHATLESRIVMLEDIAEIQADEIGALQLALEQRSDRIARSLAHLAVALSAVRAEQERTWRRRFAAWFRANVYSSRAR